MSMHKKLTLLATAAALTGVMAMVGCGDDDPGSAAADAGNDVIVTNPEGGPNPNPEAGGGDSGGDGGDAGCKFNDFVLGLIKNSTTATALPSADLGDKCVDDQTPFPATTF